MCSDVTPPQILKISLESNPLNPGYGIKRPQSIGLPQRCTSRGVQCQTMFAPTKNHTNLVSRRCEVAECDKHSAHLSSCTPLRRTETRTQTTVSRTSPPDEAKRPGIFTPSFERRHHRPRVESPEFARPRPPGRAGTSGGARGAAIAASPRSGPPERDAVGPRGFREPPRLRRASNPRTAACLRRAQSAL